MAFFVGLFAVQRSSRRSLVHHPVVVMVVCLTRTAATKHTPQTLFSRAFCYKTKTAKTVAEPTEIDDFYLMLC